MTKKITVKDLTAEEKLRLICADGFWYTVDFGGKIPRACVSDGPVGLRAEREENGKKTTLPAVSYPSVQSLANTWSRECARRTGEALADDCKERGVDILLAPGVNIKRNPLNGRNFEYFSEDPYLAGTLAYEYIDGLQSRNVGACLKHFCCNNLEYNRFHLSSEVDERTLREIYYKPFEIACAAKPVAVMSSYNRINGTYGSEYKKGYDVLRDEFGFDGAIYSDWDAVRDRTAACKAGLDIEFPFNGKNYEKLVADYKAGKLSDEELDACAARVLELGYRCEEMRRDRTVRLTTEERIEVAKKTAEESIVLLKNDGILPLKRGTKACVCGCYGKPDAGMVAGGGSSMVEWLGKGFSIPDLLSARLGTETSYEVAFYWGAVVGHGAYGCNPEISGDQAARADVCVVCAGTGAQFEYESADRLTMKLPAVQERAICELAAINPNVVVVLFAGSAIDMSGWIDRVKGVVYAGFCGEYGGEAVADVLCGAVNPSGKLSETFANSFEDYPSAHTYGNMNVVCYEEGLNVGYRYFDRNPAGVRFPFGFGLSYSEFAYSALEIQPKDGGAEISYTVENLSLRDGKEVSQVYVRECNPLVFRPVKELKGFSKDAVKSGKKVRVRVRLDFNAFAHWSVSEDRWKTTDGVYEVLVGASAADIRLAAKLEISDGKLTVL